MQTCHAFFKKVTWNHIGKNKAKVLQGDSIAMFPLPSIGRHCKNCYYGYSFLDGNTTINCLSMRFDFARVQRQLCIYDIFSKVECNHHKMKCEVLNGGCMKLNCFTTPRFLWAASFCNASSSSSRKTIIENVSIVSTISKRLPPIWHLVVFT